MENPIQPNVPPAQSLPKALVSSSTNWSKILLFILLGLVVISGSVFIGVQIGKKQISNPQPITVQPTPIPTTTLPSPTTAVTTDKPTDQTSNTGKWLVYTHTKFPDKPDWKIPWKGFTLYYPSGWKIEERKDENSPSLNLKITKNNGDYFEIIQGAGGGGYCLFPDQPEYNTFEGMATQYTNYKEIVKSNGIIWRLADWPTPNDLWTRQLCEKFDSDMFKVGYKGSTIIGFTKIKVTTPQSIQELNEILNKLEVIN